MSMAFPSPAQKANCQKSKAPAGKSSTAAALKCVKPPKMIQAMAPKTTTKRESEMRPMVGVGAEGQKEDAGPAPACQQPVFERAAAVRADEPGQEVVGVVGEADE